MKKTITAVSLLVLLSTTVQADTIGGVYIGAQMWAQNADGEIGEKVDEVSAFSFNDETHGSYYLAFEHSLPFFPNVKIEQTVFDTTGTADLNFDMTIGDQDFSKGASLDTVFDTKYLDYVFYYEIFDNGLFSFDLGLTVRDLKSDMRATGQINTAPDDEEPNLISITGSINESVFIPLAYISVSANLPFTGLSAFATGNAISFDDSSMFDYQLGLSYALVDNMLVDVNLTAGYRYVSMDLDDVEDLYIDMTFDGFFAGAVVHF